MAAIYFVNIGCQQSGKGHTTFRYNLYEKRNSMSFRMCSDYSSCWLFVLNAHQDERCINKLGQKKLRHLCNRRHSMSVISTAMKPTKKQKDSNQPITSQDFNASIHNIHWNSNTSTQKRRRLNPFAYRPTDVAKSGMCV